MIVARADRLFTLGHGASLRELLALMDLFLRIGDDRVVDLFHEAWRHRRSLTGNDAWTLGYSVKLLARNRVREIVPLLLAYLDQGTAIEHTHLKDSVAYSFTLDRYEPIVNEFLTDQRFDRWLALVQDPKEHPRFRAAFTSLLPSSHLSEAQRKRLADAFLTLTRPPHDSNLRSKSVMHLAMIGDRRVLAPLYELVMDPDQVHWVGENAFEGLFELYRKTEGIRVAAGALIDAMEMMMHIWPDRDPGLHIVQPNNYFAWAVQYRIDPARRVLEKLVEKTGVDFGWDVAAWQAWSRCLPGGSPSHARVPQDLATCE